MQEHSRRSVSLMRALITDWSATEWFDKKKIELDGHKLSAQPCGSAGVCLGASLIAERNLVPPSHPACQVTRAAAPAASQCSPVA